MKKFLSPVLYLVSLIALSGCKADVLLPSGYIAEQQRDLLIISVVLMLLIIIPVIGATLYFAWHYRDSNKDADYQPDWDHSTKLELMIWACPLLIIICLGALTWVGTHLLDPYRPLSHVTENAPVDRNVKPLQVQVVAMDWKWLFIYPEYNIAVVNELAAPVDRPINFQITSTSVMNAFYVPALAGMIYAMPGMETKLHAVINAPGTYAGFSANYSGDGFSNMKFNFIGANQTEFDSWVKTVKGSKTVLDRSTYLKTLDIRTEKHPVTYYSKVDKDMYRLILNMCVDPNKMCMGARMAIDEQGGLGMDGINLDSKITAELVAKKKKENTATKKNYINNICKPGEYETVAPAARTAIPDTTPLTGYGLQKPEVMPTRQSEKPTNKPVNQSESTSAMEGR